MASETPTTLCAASKTERRCTMRHALGWYRTLIVSGVYTTLQKDPLLDPTNINSYIPALKWCIECHPILSTAIQGEGSEAPEFVRPTNLDLHNHVKIIEPMTSGYKCTNELAFLRQATLEAHDQSFTEVERVPPWKVVVLLLPEDAGSSEKRIYIIYAYSHTHGDGKSGLAFHRTFLQGLQLAHGKYDTNTPQAVRAYVGKPVSHDPNNYRTGPQLLVVDNAQLSGVLKACRAQSAKFTGLLNQLVVRALSKTLPAEMGCESFIGRIVVDLRSLIPAYSDESWGTNIDLKRDHAFWDAVCGTTAQLAASANTLEDQPMGLLKYLRNFRKWYLGQLRKDRDSSYEISNVGVFDPSGPSQSTTAITANEEGEYVWDIEKMIFSQPANVTSCPLNFQVVTRKGGDMIISLNWQIGVLGVADENVFAKEILDIIMDLLAEVASGST